MPESFRNQNHQRVSTSPAWATVSRQVFSLKTTKDSLRATRNEGRWPYSSQAITFSPNINEHILTEGPAVSIKNSSRNFPGYPSF